MKAKYENGRFSFDLSDLFDSLTAEDKRAVADTLSCEDDIIRDVTEQILHGWTEMASHGAILCTARADPTTGHALDWAIRQIALRADEVAVKEIKRLQEALAYVEKQYRELFDERLRRCQ